jgi:hypothetical protein
MLARRQGVSPQGGGGVPVNTVLPSISGSTVEPATLTAANGTWTKTPTSYTYLWYSNATTTGITTSTYTTGAGDVGNTITVAVTAHNVAGASSPATSSGVTITAAGGIAIAQQVDSATSTVTTLSLSAVTAGNMAVVIGGGASAMGSPSGLGGTWAQIGSTVVNGPRVDQIWVGSGLVSGTSVTWSNGAYATLMEISGATTATDGGHASGTGTSPALTITGIATNNMVFAFRDSQAIPSASPSSPWVNYGGGGYWASQYFGLAHQIASSSANLTPTWTQASATWGVLGLILA